jgi:uncharacterized protein YaaN involved in tellurite resistance
MAGIFASLLAIGQPAFANDRESLETLRETTLNLIDALVEQGIFTRAQAEAMVKGAQVKAAKSAAKQKASVAVAPVRPAFWPGLVRRMARVPTRLKIGSDFACGLV